ncbi:oxidoreductase [Devosia sp.]|uniref:oxidoreductase n=1 Tax=Devosia sp. TaxID=1871048 RepID=UPI001AD03616|nr:oxidoreductase [Devosia sp.]MBN9333098.1 oxidoreductase [Devosia sp.]
MSFRALVTQRAEDGSVTNAVEMFDDSRLPEGNVTVDIDWADLNYKDGLCLTGQGGLVRAFPHIAGIDFAGAVRESSDSRYRPGDAVVLTGWRVGETHWGGFSERARVNGDWLVPLPKGLSARDAMIVGTAGLTAMLAIIRLEAAGLAPSSGEVLVTGASGGVGSIAISLLARLGYAAVALSGRPENSDALTALGATRIVERAEFLAEAEKPLEPARWAGVVDCVGGNVLGKVLKQVKYGGSVAALGNTAGIGLNTNVLPFLLRGVNLLGIDSVMQPYGRRIAAWQRVAELFDISAYASLVEEVTLEALPEAAGRILRGEVRGRVLVNPKG